MSKGKTIKWGLLVLLALVLFLQPVLGQVSGRGEVRGVVRDQNQAVIPGADVTAVNQATNRTLTTITSDVGAYFLGGVPIGDYSLSIEMPGFNTWTTQFSLQAGSTVTIDAELQVGDISTSIEVTDTVSEVSIDRLEVADVKDFARIQQLPLNGRSITNLFELTPGVEGGGSPRVVGMKVGSTEMTLDGVSLVDRFGGGMARVQPGLDVVQEFRIETVGSDARFSRPSTVTLVSRSGTNEVHGSVFWTHRNNGAGLRARRREEGNETSKLIRNEFGVTVGGPLWLGNLYDGRDKTFWFFSYEGLRTRKSAFNSTWPGPYVPMAEWWDGDYSNLITGNEEPITLYDPFSTRADGTRDPLPNNQVPQERFHPLSATLESITAKPANSNNPALAPNWEYFYPRNNDNDLFTVKADQVIGEKDNLSVRWTRSTNSNFTAGGVFGNPPPDNPTGGGGSRRSDATVNNVAVNWNRAFNPSLLNELLVGVHRTWKSSGTLSDFEKWPDKLGFPNPFDATGWPTFGAWDTPGAVWDGDNRKDEPQTHVTLENNATWVKGDHVLQFGGKAKIEHDHVQELQQAQGSHSFYGNWTGLWDPVDEVSVSRTGTGLAAAQMGLGTYFSNQFNRGFFYFRQNEFGLFVNDKWKVTPKLTVNLGLRWDHWTPYREKQDRLVDVDFNSFYDKNPDGSSLFQVVTPGDTRVEDIPGIPSGVLDSWAARGLTWTTANSIGYPSALFKPDYNNFGPRLGLSYMINDKTVIRGSYGQYYWTMPLAQMLQSARSNPPLNLRFTNEPDFKPGNLDPTGDDAIYTWTNAPDTSDFVQNIVVETTGTVFISSSARGMFMSDGRNWGDALARTWHATFEHEIMRNTALRLTYTGTQGRDLEQRNTINDREAEWNYVNRVGENYPTGGFNLDQLRPNSEWNPRYQDRSGFSNTHSAQFEVERRFSDGIGFQAFYVYTQSKTTTDAGGFTHGGTSINSTGAGTRTPAFVNLYQYPNPVGPVYTSSPSREALLDLTYINSANIPPHRVRFNGIVDLPFGRGKPVGADVSSAVNQVIGGWQVAFIGDWRGGFYSTINTSRGVFGNYLIDPGDRPVVEIFGNNQILWFAGDVSPSSCDGGDCAAMASFIPEDRGQRPIRPYGDNFDNRLPVTLNDGSTRQTDVLSGLYWPFERNNWRGSRAWNLDLSIFKHFYFTEDFKMRFTADFFNVFNHPNNPNPSTTSGLVNLGQQSNEPRTVQLSLRFDF